MSELFASAGSMIAAAVDTVETNPVLNMSIFAAFVAVTMFIVIRASRNNSSAADYYAGGRSFTGPQNGFAISGDYLSAASFLGIVGAIAVNGYDGFLYSIGFLVAWLVALLLVAELMRNTGKFTMADVLSFRLKQAPVRMAAAITTLAVCFFYLLAQMAGAGGLVSLLMGIDGSIGQSVVIAVVGIIMVLYVLIGGMKGTTWVQIVKAFLLIGGALVMTIWVLALNGFSLNTLLESAVAASEHGDKILGPGLQYANPLDFLSLALALVLGTAGLPHVLMRFYTVPTAKEARRSVVWAIWLIGLFYLLSLVLGYGAGALVGPEQILAAPGGVNSAAPLLANALGGPLLMGIISAVAFATILAVVAGLTITASASFAHDIYANVIKKGKVSGNGEVRVARITTIVVGVLAIVGGIGVQGQNVAFLVALAFAVAASANLPTILYSLFWRRFTT
ncbi:solute symporter family protein, partial [Microbacterium sp.]|uniref:solute symporter family protein n=1 Tax=Microbacterium sp. TaxID=51671 RepID=UPI003F969893